MLWCIQAHHNKSSGWNVPSLYSLNCIPSHMLWIVKYCLSTFALWCLHPQQGLWICECSWLTLRQNKSFLIVRVCLKQWKRKIKTGRKWDRKMGGGNERFLHPVKLRPSWLTITSAVSVRLLPPPAASIDIWVCGGSFRLFYFCLYKNRQRSCVCDSTQKMIYWLHEQTPNYAISCRGCCFPFASVWFIWGVAAFVLYLVCVNMNSWEEREERFTKGLG